MQRFIGLNVPHEMTHLCVIVAMARNGSIDLPFDYRAYVRNGRATGQTG
jgi:hypothetical protein